MILSKTEIAVHGLANGAALVVLMSSLMKYLQNGDRWLLVVQMPLALLILLLSVLIVARRVSTETRRLRAPEILLSVLVGALGAAASLMALSLMASGVTYKGDSPDAGGMGMMFGLFLYYPSAGLLILPLAMKASHLSPRLRRGLAWSVPLLVLLPFAVLTVARLFVAN